MVRISCMTAILCVGLSIVCLAMVSGFCPKKCQCQTDALFCYNMTKLPKRWPENTERIIISKSRFREIPAGAFANLNTLRRLKIEYTSITRIRTCAFSRLNNILLVMHSCIVNRVEPYAFSYLNGTELSFSLTKLTVLSPYAFVDSGNAENWDFIQTNITTAEPRAYHNISNIKSINFMNNYFHEVKSLALSNLVNVGMITVVESVIDFLYCRTFTEVVRTVGYFGFYGNLLYCDCRLEWLFTSGILTSQGRTENRCHGPKSLLDKGYGKRLGDLEVSSLPCENVELRGVACPDLYFPPDPKHQCIFHKPTSRKTTTVKPPTTVAAEASSKVTVKRNDLAQHENMTSYGQMAPLVAVYVMLGRIPPQAEQDRRALSMVSNGPNGTCRHFDHLGPMLQKYDLPTAQELNGQPPDSRSWNRQINLAIPVYWQNKDGN